MKACMRMPTWTKFYLNLLMHMACLAIILCVVFFVIIVPAERDALRGELRKAIREAVEGSGVEIKNTDDLKTDLEQVRDALLRGDAPGMEALNAQTRVVAGMLAGGLSVLFVTTYAALRISCSYCREFFSLLVENLVTFTMVGVIEYLFFTHVALGYVPTPPSLIAKATLAAVKRAVM